MATVCVMVKVKLPSPFSAHIVKFNMDEADVPPKGTDISFTVVGEVTGVLPAPLPAT